MTLQVLIEHQLYAKFNKCEFSLRSVTFHSHVLSAQGVEVDLKKIESVKSWTSPLTPLEIRLFLGLANYYRRFVEGFSLLFLY